MEKIVTTTMMVFMVLGALDRAVFRNRFGLGNEFVQSVTNRDYSMLLGVTVFYGTMLVFFAFLVDLIYVVIDPRIKLQDADV